MLYEVITVGLRIGGGDDELERATDGGEQHAPLAGGHRITSYNVCYTKLLRGCDEW